ncbi:MAG TPA: adenylate/guanylate cyclase domain-containing protein [Actinomycetota bacterium]|nr:adenylate/guanylate cyclase domain-containing protein [Actinomycetota bacterium]
MSKFSIEEAAQRSGVDSDYVHGLVELGILTPGKDGAFSPGDVRRVRLVHSLERAGIPLEGMAAAVGNGELSFAFMDLPVFDRFSGLSGTTFRELGAKTGIPVELLMLVREAIGFAQPTPDDQVRDDELLIVPAIELQLARGLRTTTIERWLQVYGDSLRRMAETESDWWRAEVELPLIESGIGEGEVLNEASRWGAQFAPLHDQAIGAIFHGHEEHAWLKNMILNVENALEEAGLRSKLLRVPAIAFLDITGYTRLTEERGDEAAAELAAQLSRVVQRTSRQHGGKPVKWLGDGVMFYFSEPAPGVLAALEMVDHVVGADLPPAHVGLHAGPVVPQDGDYFGRTVNTAARIAEYARPGEVVVTQEVVDAAEGYSLTFSRIGPVELKGVAEIPTLYAARRRE